MCILLSTMEGPDDMLLYTGSVKRVIKIQYSWQFDVLERSMTPNAERMIDAGQISSGKYYKFWKRSDKLNM